MGTFSCKSREVLGPQENQELREKELGKVMCIQCGGLRGGKNDVMK